MAHIDEALKIDGPIEVEVPMIMRRLRYPVEVNKSKLQAIAGPNTWPQLLAVLEWLINLIRINEERIRPLAACEVGLERIGGLDGAGSVGLDFHEDGGGGEPLDHLVRKSYLDGYAQYLEGYDEQGEAHLQHMFDEKRSVVHDEIARLEEQYTHYSERLHEYQVEHTRLEKLQSEPRHLDLENDRLRSTLTSQEQQIEAMEHDMTMMEAEENTLLHEIERLNERRGDLDRQVKIQEYSKRDVDRFRKEEDHLNSQKDELRS